MLGWSHGRIHSGSYWNTTIENSFKEPPLVESIRFLHHEERMKHQSPSVKRAIEELFVMKERKGTHDRAQEVRVSSV